jgi:hypothetical protein
MEFLLLTLIGIVVIAIATINLKKIKETKNWESVNGKVTESIARTTKGEHGEGSKSLFALTYQYFVNEKEFNNGRNYLTQTNYNVYDEQKKYPIGKEVTVHYNPNNPQESALILGTYTGVYIQMTIGAIAVLTGIFLAIFF